MIFLKGGLYKHRNNTDVAVRIRHYHITPSGTIKLKIDWINIVNPVNHYYTASELIVVRKEDTENWRHLGQ